MQKVLIIDTSIMCCWLQVQGKDTCGSKDDSWNYNRVTEHIKLRLSQGCYLVFPLATLIETGNHIANSAGLRYEQAKALCDMLSRAANSDNPWAAFTEQASLFSSEKILNISNNWPDRAAGGTSIGDFLIIDVANYYADAGIEVELLTGDAGLKAFEPEKKALIPRRRQ